MRGKRQRERVDSRNPAPIDPKTAKLEWNRWKRQVSDFMVFRPLLEKLIHTKSDDNRLFMSIKILGMKVQGLLDSGAHRTIVGDEGYAVLVKLGFKLKPNSHKLKVKFGNGDLSEVVGYMDIPMEVANHVKMIEVLICAGVPQPFTLGMDFWRQFGLLPEIANGSCEISTVREVATIELIKPRQNLTTMEEDKLALLIQQHFTDMGTKLGCTTLVHHKIDTGTTEPIKQRYYPVSPTKQAAINEELDNMLRLGVVEPSTSAYSSPILLITKKDGTRRFCVDFRKINKVTKRDAYPIPYVSAILDRLRDCKYLSSIDLKSAYWQVPLEESSKEKTAFTVPGRGLYQFTKMPFGLHNSPATWQRLVDRVLGPELEPQVFVYLDDIIIATKTFQDHLSVLDNVFTRLKQAGLTVNQEKCVFCREELRYLGYVINSQGLHVDPAKVEAIINYPPPKNAKEVRRFIGMTSWYRRFVPNFSTLIAPINIFTRKGQKFQWNLEAEEAFNELKSKLVEAPIMSCPDFNKPFILQTDASSYGLGWVLSQNMEVGERVIAYGSRSLTKQEKNMSATERECLAVIWAIEKNRPYLEGSRFSVITDHHSLVWLHNLKDPGGRLSRWALRLQPYDYDIIHRKGKDHLVPDALSRAVPDLTELDNGRSTHIQLDLISIPRVVTDNWYNRMLKKVCDNQLLYPKWRIQDEKLYKNVGTWKLVVPKDQRLEVFKECHDHPTAGHLGIYKTYHRVQSTYYWPKLKHDVAKYVNKCAVCLQYKPEQKAPAGLMGKPKEVQHPWQLISTDIMGPFPRSTQGNKYLLVVADWFTKYTLLFPLRTATASKIIKHIEEDVFLVYGAPQTIVCDNGTQYAGKALKQLAKEYECRLFFNARYHPQVNPTERINRVLKTMISSYVADQHNTWDKNIAKLGFALRTAKHEVTGHTPAFLNFGREIFLSGKVHGTPEDGNKVPVCADREGDQKTQERLQVFKDVQRRMKQSYEISAERYNLRRRPQDFQVGQAVYKRNFVLSNASNKFTAKLAPKFIGPFLIKKKLSPLVYELESNNKKSLGHWHVADLKLDPQ